MTIAEARALPVGPATGRLCGVYVTYARTNAYALQRQRSGPAIWVFVGSPAGIPSVGNRLDLTFSRVEEFASSKQVEGVTIVDNDGASFDVVGNLAQDFSAGAGTPPTEATETQLITLTGATVTGMSGPNWVVDYGTSTTAMFFADDDPGLCVGAVFDLVGLSHDFNGHQIVSFSSADFIDIDAAGCSP